MDEKLLSIIEIQKILDMSYPTAVKWAQSRGEKGGYGQKWRVPALEVQIELDYRLYLVTKGQDELDTICANGQS